MVLFDNEIKEVLALLKDYKNLDLTEDLLEDVGKNNMIFSDETAYELGGGINKSLSFELVSSSLIDNDEILLIGKDLYEINKDTPFIRISLVKVIDEDKKGDKLYDQLEKIKFSKYRVSPKGYMLRTTSGNKEKVRVSKELVNDKTSFSKIGSAYIKAYKQIPSVINVKEIFITDNSLYEELIKICNKKNQIQDALDHILKGMVLNDCNACSVKELCDEVEGMRQIHQNNK